MSVRSNFPRVLLSLVLTFALVTTAAAAGRFPVGDVAPLPPPVTDARFVPDQLLVRFDPSVGPLARVQLVSGEHAQIRRELATPGLVLLDLPVNSDVPGAAIAWQRRPGVMYAEPNFVYELAVEPNDPRFGDEWGLDNPGDHDIDAPEAWNITTGSTNVIVAVVDTGVDYTHPDLAANIWTNPGETLDGQDNDGNGFVDDVRGWDFVGNDNDPIDRTGHGTHVAGTIGARGNNATGIAGVNWQVSLMPVRAGNSAGLSNADVVDSFAYACGNGARIVNGSFGGSGYSAAIHDAIADCPQALFVFAAGNEGIDVGTSAVYPCAFALDNIVCVGASDSADELTSYSNYSAAQVDLAAPGDSIVSAAVKRAFFKDGFESGLGKWTPDKVSGKSWSRTSEWSASGSYSATDSAGSNYANNSDTWLETSSPINLAGGTYCELAYTYLVDLEVDYDFLAVYASKNGGANWTFLSGWTGAGVGRDTVNLRAEGFDGSATFDLAFRLVSDVSNVHDGAHIDDVVVACHPATYGKGDYVAMSGTSMATPHVAGVAALVLAAHPNLTVASVRQAILDGVDPLVPLSGLVATGGRLNALGALEAVETTRPIAAAPSQRLITNATLTASAIPVRVTWAAATDDAPSSGILNYKLQQREKSGGTWGPWKTVATTSAVSRTVKLPPGTYKFRLRAQDRAGNWSGWKAGSAFDLEAPPDGAITFAGAWSTHSGAEYFGGSTRATGTRGRTAFLAFTGREVAWVSVRGLNRGRAKVYIDGVLVKTVDLYAAKLKVRRVVFRKRWGSSGAHTIEIKVTSRNGASTGSRVDLDAYVILE